MLQEKPSFLRILRKDYDAYNSAVLFPIIGLLLILDLLFNLYGTWFSYLALAMMAYSVITLILRYRKILSLLENGVETASTVKSVQPFRGNIKIKYGFNFRGDEFSITTNNMRNTKTKNIKTGDEVVLLVDPDNPKKIMAKDAFSQETK
jgi:hypothetical protein